MNTAVTPYGQAMLEYWHGDTEAAYTIHRDDGFSHLVPVAPSFADAPFSALERLALERCVGRVLDAGAGVGRHTLFLQARGHPVTALEVEPVLAGMMAERGVITPVAGSLFSLPSGEFDTMLMLMNGFGLVGTLSGAARFFEQTRKLLSRDGQVLCDSMDVRQTANPTHLAYQEANRRAGRPAGQMRFRIEYRGRGGEPFDWLHLDFDSLRGLALDHGFAAELLLREESGRYLARLVPESARGSEPGNEHAIAAGRECQITP